MDSVLTSKYQIIYAFVWSFKNYNSGVVRAHDGIDNWYASGDHVKYNENVTGQSQRVGATFNTLLLSSVKEYILKFRWYE